MKKLKRMKKYKSYFISVIIPIKGHRVIERLLNKLEDIPKPEKTEILVVDASEGALDDIKKKFPSVRWIYFHNKNYLKKSTIPEQRNLGIKKSRGNILVFIDADCIPAKNWLTKLINPLIHEKENIIGGLIRSYGGKRTKYDLYYENIKRNKYIDFCPTMNSAFKREVFENIGNYDPVFEFGGEDDDICIRAINYGYKIRYNPKAIIYHDWGNLKRNLLRSIVYGKSNYSLLKKYPKRILKFSTIRYLIYLVYLFFLPLTFISPYYLLPLAVLILKNTFETKSIYLTLESISSTFVYSVGMFIGFLNNLFKK